jgi:hypothetical protein
MLKQMTNISTLSFINVQNLDVNKYLLRESIFIVRARAYFVIFFISPLFYFTPLPFPTCRDRFYKGREGEKRCFLYKYIKILIGILSGISVRIVIFSNFYSPLKKLLK